MACWATTSASDDPSAVAVAVTAVTVRVDTDDVMLVRARRVVPLVNLLLNCELFLDLEMAPTSGPVELFKQRVLTRFTAVVVPVVAELLPPLKRTEFI